MRTWILGFLCLFLLSGVPLTQAVQADRAAASVDVADALQEQAPAAVAVPRLASPVTDLTGTLDSDWVASMRQRLLALQQRKGSQIAILMLPSTGEDSIEQYATRVFEQWRLGRQGVDDGVLVLVVKDDRTMRIEVGYGLEGAIPDVSAARIIREYMVPSFRDGDFAGGIQRAVEVLERLIDGETLPEERQQGGLTLEGWLLLIGLGAGAVAGIALRRRWFSVRAVLLASTCLALLLAFSSGLDAAPMLLFVLPFCLFTGGGIGALAASSRKAAWVVCGLIGYLVALMLLASHFDGGDVALYGLAAPIGGTVALIFLCLPFFLAYGTWKRSRLEFCIRLALAGGIAGFVVYATGVPLWPWVLPDSLALIPMLYVPMLVAFLAGGSSGSGPGSDSSSGGSSSSSSGGSSYSGGGGSSGGGGASGSW